MTDGARTEQDQTSPGPPDKTTVQYYRSSNDTVITIMTNFAIIQLSQIAKNYYRWLVRNGKIVYSMVQSLVHVYTTKKGAVAQW